jgi:T4 RnlA family RNA ligase
MNKYQIAEQLRLKNLVVNKHPGAELYIYNYSRSCQYEMNWNEITLNCRGLILDKDLNVVARPFGKFFNYEEHGTERLKSKVPEIPNLPYKVYAKLDGSLGILYWVGDSPFIATRGSFVSDQAIHATKILSTKHKDKSKFLNKNWTYLFEIIYPSNRIVLDYQDTDDIVLLAVIINETGAEYDIYDDRVNPGFETVTEYKEFEGKTFRQLQKMNINNEEGFVLRYANGFRVKVKFKEYVRLHSLLTNVTEKKIWENLMNGDSLEELINSIPDESFGWIKVEINRLKKEYNDTEVLAINTYNKLEGELFGTPFKVHRKKFAQTVFENNETARIAHILFAMLDGKEYSKIIWSLLKPEDKDEGSNRKTN